MKKLLLLISFFTVTLCSSAQERADTIYSSNGQKFACNIIEVNEQSVRFNYPGESHANSMFFNVIQKIVYKSGRTQEFAAATSFKKMISPDDRDNVAISHLESEIMGLYKLGETGAKAKGTTTLSSQEQVKQRAIRKLKAKVAMMGGNVILVVNMRQEGNTSGSSGGWISSGGGWGFGGGSSGNSSETNLTGIVYNNALPSMDALKKVIGNNSTMTLSVTYKMANSDADYFRRDTKDILTIQNVGSDNGILYVEGNIGKSKKTIKYIVSYVGDRDFHIYFQDKDIMYAYKVE